MEELKAKIEVYLKAVGKHRFLILILGLLFAVVMMLYARSSTTYFEAHSTFHPETNSNSTPSFSGSPLSALLGSGGLDLNEADMMEEVLKSRKLSNNIAADSIVTEGEKRLIADLVIEHHPPGFSLRSFFSQLFSGPAAPASYVAKISRAASLLKSYLSIEKGESGFLSMDFRYPNSGFTSIFAKKYIEVLSDYYKNQKTEKAKINLIFFTHRADSVKMELDKAVRAAAAFTDRNRGLVLSQRRVFVNEQEVKVSYLSEMYKALVTSREQAASQLQRETPIIQILDEPEPPFRVISKSSFVYFWVGLFLGLGIGIFWAIRKLLLKEVSNYLKESFENAGSSSQEESYLEE